MSHIQIFFSSFSSNIRSGLLDVVVFLDLNSKSQMSVALLFSSTVPRSHRSLYHTVSVPNNSCSFAQVIASIINALLCLAKYSVLARTLQPANIPPPLALARSTLYTFRPQPILELLSTISSQSSSPTLTLLRMSSWGEDSESAIDDIQVLAL